MDTLPTQEVPDNTPPPSGTLDLVGGVPGGRRLLLGRWLLRRRLRRGRIAVRPAQLALEAVEHPDLDVLGPVLDGHHQPDALAARALEPHQLERAAEALALVGDLEEDVAGLGVLLDDRGVLVDAQ